MRLERYHETIGRDTLRKNPEVEALSHVIVMHFKVRHVTTPLFPSSLISANL